VLRRPGSRSSGTRSATAAPASSSPGWTVTRERAGPHRRHRSATTCACRRPIWQRRLSAAWSWERPSRISSPAATGGRYSLTQPVIRSA